MDDKILVTYASKHGATAEIAERIGALIAQQGREVETLPVDRVSGLAGYSAVVLGVALYMGRWRKEAVRFLNRNAEELSNRAFWLFLTGPTGEGDPVELLEGRQVPPLQRALIDRIHPRDVAVFGGALQPAKLGGFEKWIIDRVKAPAGDFRDWNAIESWSRSIAEGLAPVK